MDYLLIASGLVMLLAGGEGILRGSLAIANRFGLSAFFVGVVIVGFGTSLPELMVSVSAALKGEAGIALGNVVGSNIANILFILGLTAVIAPVCCLTEGVRRDAIAVVLVSALLVALSFLDVVGLLVGVPMLAGLAVYMGWVYRTERNQTSDEGEAVEDELAAHHAPTKLWMAVLYCLGGLVLLVVGADFLVDGATALALGLGISKAVIGLTLVAVGTSLPELAASIVAAVRRHSGIVIGNILGSNLFNILGVLGATMVISPLPFVGRIADIDVWIMLFVALALLFAVLVQRKVGRLAGAVFVVAYVAYLMALFAGGAQAAG